MMQREVQEKLLDKCRVQWSTVKDDDVARTVVAVLEEVKELAKSRREQLIPVPMDISHVVPAPVDPQTSMKLTAQDECADDEWAGYEEWYDWRENDVNVNLVGKGFGGGKGGKGKGKSRSCFNCGALGSARKGRAKEKTKVVERECGSSGASLAEKARAGKEVNLATLADHSLTS